MISRWEDIQEAPEAVREREAGCRAEAAGGVWATQQEGAVESPICSQPHSEQCEDAAHLR